MGEQLAVMFLNGNYIPIVLLLLLLLIANGIVTNSRGLVSDWSKHQKDSHKAELQTYKEVALLIAKSITRISISLERLADAYEKTHIDT